MKPFYSPLLLDSQFSDYFLATQYSYFQYYIWSKNMTEREGMWLECEEYY